MRSLFRRRESDVRAPLPSVVPAGVVSAGVEQPAGELRQAIETGRNRLVLGGALFAIAFGVIALRLVDVAALQAADGDGAAASVQRAEPRAEITDRNGILLAGNLATASLYANPRQVIDPDASARRLVQILPGLNEAEVAARLKLDRAFIWLRRSVTPHQQQEVIRAGIPGLYFQREDRRVYPHGPLAAHVVGLTDVDNAGLAGVEKYFDEVLRQSDEPLQLALDARVQHVLRDELQRAMAKFHAIGAAGMVLDARNGEILSMVSLPDFDPNHPGTATPEALFNRNTLGVYEMGSTFKLLTAAMALDAGTTTLKGGYDASHPIRIARFTISDYKGKNRWLSVPEIMIYSSNIGAAKMALDVGTAGQRAFLDRIGMLRTPTIELPEVGAPLAPAQWREINTITIAFGHGLSVSPLQLVSGIAALVNGGMLYPATLLKRPGGLAPAGKRVISQKTSDEMRWLMRQVVERGTGKNADTVAYPVGGKTGTAEKIGGGGYRQKALLSSFVGAFPIDDPRYVILAMLDEPHGTKETYGYATGGWVAAPIASAFVRRAGPLLGLPPDPSADPGREPPLVQASAPLRTFPAR